MPPKAQDLIPKREKSKTQRLREEREERRAKKAREEQFWDMAEHFSQGNPELRRVFFWEEGGRKPPVAVAFSHNDYQIKQLRMQISQNLLRETTQDNESLKKQLKEHEDFKEEFYKHLSDRKKKEELAEDYLDNKLHFELPLAPTGPPSVSPSESSRETSPELI